MGNKKITIKDIANQAGVSIATVSHVINRTRYVSPELIERVETIMKKSGYIGKVKEKERKLRMGRASAIVGVFPNIISVIYQNMSVALRKLVTEHGYQFWIMITDNNLSEEAQILDSLIQNKKVAGILYVPIMDSVVNYRKLIDSGVPFVCMERNILGAGVDSVVFQDRLALYKGTSYLIDSGHKNLLFIREAIDSTTREEQTRGYLEALKKINCNENDANILDVNLHWPEDKCQQIIRNSLRMIAPTAVIASGNRMTLHVLKAVRNMGMKCPEEISMIGFGDEMWVELMEPPLTTLERGVKDLSFLAADMLFKKINTGKNLAQSAYADVKLVIRKSTRMMDNGPYGEVTASPDSIVLTSEEKSKLRNGKYRVAISFHYTGTAWAELHEDGIRDGLEKYGIDVISVMDAHFDSALQNIQLDGIRIQEPDAVIAIPTDDEKTVQKFQELSKVTKLVFISNVPQNIEKNGYVSCISVNEWENGTNVGRMIGEYFRDTKNGKVGFISHGAVFYGTRVRDTAAEKFLADNYPDVTVVSSRGFGRIENAYQVCMDMIKLHPEIQALYVSWDQPALQAIRALKELKREDIAVFTTDLDKEIAQYMKEGIVKGLSTQRPYEQGYAVALVVAKALVNDQVPKYVGVQPYMVEPGQLARAWKEIFHAPMGK